jgi:hypothetical protein
MIKYDDYLKFVGMVEKAINDLEKQGKPAMRFNSSNVGVACSYRMTLPDGGGLKCIVGHMIQDEDYFEGMEGCGISDNGSIFEALAKSCDVPFLAEDCYKRSLENALLCNLQDAHDTYKSVPTRPNNFLEETIPKMRELLSEYREQLQRVWVNVNVPQEVM